MYDSICGSFNTRMLCACWLMEFFEPASLVLLEYTLVELGLSSFCYMRSQGHIHNLLDERWIILHNMNWVLGTRHKLVSSSFFKINNITCQWHVQRFPWRCLLKVGSGARVGYKLEPKLCSPLLPLGVQKEVS